jgi:CheY-like chemotaxis protein
MYNEIMIIDDSNIDRFLMEVVIKNISFTGRITSFNSADKALEHLRSLGTEPGLFPDVILLDIFMPVMTGFDFLDAFLAFPEELRRHCYIAILSSTRNDEDFAKMKRYPVINKFLEKPVSEEDIAGILNL